MKGIAEADKEAFEQRLKANFKAIFDIVFDSEIGKCVEDNPQLKAAMEAGNKSMKSLALRMKIQKKTIK